MTVDGVTVEWKERHFENGFSSGLAGIGLDVSRSTTRQYYGAARFPWGRWQTGPLRRTIAEAKADAIRLGRELVEDTVRATRILAEGWGVDFDED